MSTCRHCKPGVRERLETLAGIFEVDVTGFVMKSNHLHVILRTGPTSWRTGRTRKWHAGNSKNGAESVHYGKFMTCQRSRGRTSCERRRPCRNAGSGWPAYGGLCERRCDWTPTSSDSSRLDWAPGTRGRFGILTMRCHSQRLATDPRPADDRWRLLARQRAAFRPLVPSRPMAAPRTCNPPPLAPESVGSPASAHVAGRFPNSSRVPSARFSHFFPHAARGHVAFGATIRRKRAASAPPFAIPLVAFGNPCRRRAELD